MPFCTNCGMEIDQSQKFCSECGKAVQARTEEQSAGTEPATPTPVKKSKSKLIWILLPVIAVAVIAVVFIIQANKVKFEDGNLAAAVSDAVGKPAGEIVKKDVAQLVELDASNKEISSLKGIEQLASLEILNLSCNNISDISVLQGLPELKELHIDRNKLDTSENSPGRNMIEKLKARGVNVTWLPRGNTPGNIVNAGLAAEQDGWIYYSIPDDRIYKVRTDGSGRMNVNNDNSFFINVVGDWIYYFNYDDHDQIYKIRTDGSGRTRVE